MAVAPRPRRSAPTAIVALIGVLIAATAALLLPAAAIAADPSDPAPPDGPVLLDDQVTFFGRGYGHGVGMSQYGARGRALDGQSAAEILAHYYPGAKPALLADVIARDPVVRVLVLEGFRASKAKPLVIVGLKTSWTIDGVAGTFPPKARLTLTPKAATKGGATTVSWRRTVTAPDGRTLSDAKGITKAFTIRSTGATGLLRVVSRNDRYDRYRGTLRVRPSTTKKSVNVVDRVRMETYLRGVVPAEMPRSWPEAALEAQAIAARSYAAYRLRPGVGSYDIHDDTRSQVYLGVRVEAPETDAAIAATAGQILRKGKKPANTLYHSTGGGATEDNEKAFTSSTGARVAAVVSYLRGSPDRRQDGSAYDEAAPYATWKMRTYARTQLSAWFAADPRTDVGDLTALDLRDRGVSGRLVSVTLIGSEGEKRVSGEVFRSILNGARPAGDPMLRSTLFDLQPIP